MLFFFFFVKKVYNKNTLKSLYMFYVWKKYNLCRVKTKLKFVKKMYKNNIFICI